MSLLEIYFPTQKGETCLKVGRCACRINSPSCKDKKGRLSCNTANRLSYVYGKGLTTLKENIDKVLRENKS